jgi:hypothetical protein
MRRMRKPKPIRTAMLSPLRLDPGVTDQSEGCGEYDALALFAYVRSAVLINQPPHVTTTYLIVRTTGPEEEGVYMRIGRMELTEELDMSGGLEYIPEGVQRDVTLV